MFTVFIADDEAKVISGLIHRVSWEKLDSCVVGYADNGKDAKEKILELHPDIVITDIYMPGMTGIELINELTDVVDSVFIIFSAYSEFEYAREAIHLNVTDYLIKPVNICEIENTLERAQNRITEKRRSSVTKNEEYTLLRILDGIQVEAEEMTLETGLAVLTAILGFEKEDTRIINGQEIVKRWSPINGKIYTVRRGRKLIIVAVQKQYDTDGSLRRWLLMRVKELLEAGFMFFWGIGCVVGGWTELLRSICSAEEMLDYAEFYQRQVEEMDADTGRKPVRERIMGYQEELVFHLDNPVRAKEICNQIYDLLKENVGDSEKVKVSMIEFLYYFRMKIEEVYKQKIDIKDLDWETDVIYSLLKAETLDNMFSVLEIVVSKIRLLISEQDSVTAHGIIGKIQKYICHHLKNEISLAEISEYVERNPTYISHVFKTVTGETLFEYITRLRIERAMQLLRESTMKIQEIAIEVGYEEQSYFSQVFKKYTGQTAGGYRKATYNITDIEETNGFNM